MNHVYRSRVPTGLCLVGLVCIGLAAFADVARAAPSADLADEAQFHFSRGNRMYQTGRLDDALASYYLSNRLVPNRNVQFNIARCLERLGRFEESFRAWQTLLDEGLPAAERAEVVASIEALQPHLALVQITSEPPGATIYVERSDLGSRGTTPKVLSLSPGPTRILLELSGYRPRDISVKLVRGEKVNVRGALERILGQLDLRGVPETAEIRRDFVDGPRLRQGPGLVHAVPGRLVLFVSAPGFETARITADVAPDAVTRLDIPLVPQPPAAGTVIVRSNVTGALVRVDGKEAGFTPTVIEAVPVGTRDIEVLETGREPFQTRVEVKQGERAFVDAHLRRAGAEVIAASKTLELADDTPASTTVVTAEEIAAFGYTTLAEALAGVRGAFSSNDRSYESVGFRGFSPPGDYTNRVLVLVDGHPLNDLMTGGGPVGDDRDVDLSQVRRIEVVRGPGSVLYGTGALFGVINVVTRQPAEGVHASASGFAGSLGQAAGRVSASARRGRAEVAITAAALDSTGDRRFAWPSTETTPGPLVLGADGSTVRHADLSARLGTLGSGSLALRAGINDRMKAFPTGAYGTGDTPGSVDQPSTLHDRRTYAELHLEQPLGGFTLAARVAYDESWYTGTFRMPADPATDTPAGTDTEHLVARWTTGELRLQLPSIFGHRLTLGAQAEKQIDIVVEEPEGTAPNLKPVQPELILSGYAVDEWRLHERLRVNAGVRYERYSRSAGPTLNPRFAVVARPYRGGNSKLFVGRAFRSPSPYELGNVGDAGLGPEIAWSGEIEHAHTLSDDLRVTASVFASQVSGLIVLAETGNNAQSAYTNMGDSVRSLGAEAELRWDPGAGSLVALAYSRQRVTIETSAGAVPFANAPESLLSLRARVPVVASYLMLATELQWDAGRHREETPSTLQAIWNDASLSSDQRDRALSALHETSRVDDALIWNVVLSGYDRRRGLRYFAGLFNLLDVTGYATGYPTSQDFLTTTVPRYGRSLRAGLSFEY